MTVMIGIGSADLWGTWKTDEKLEDEIRVQALVGIDSKGCASAILESDLSLVWPSIALEIRSAVSGALDTAAENIGIFCTQNHASPFLDGTAENFADRSLVTERFVEAAVRARDTALPAEYAYVETADNTYRPVCRRKEINGLGAVTFVCGYELRGDGSVCVAELLKQALHGLAAGDVKVRRSQYDLAEAREFKDRAAACSIDAFISEPMILDGITDTRIQGLFFRSLEGEPIGSLSRWAAHPVCATGGGGKMSGDYPVYVRRRLAESFGGEPIHCAGPCGNQAPPVSDKSVELARRIGRDVADALLKELSTTDWSPVQALSSATASFELPLRADIPLNESRCREAYEEALKELQHARDRGEELPRLKQLSDRIEVLGFWTRGLMQSCTGLGFSDLKKRSVSHPLFALRINDTVIAGLPGEPFGTYSIKLREICNEVNLITSEQCNGYLGYIPGDRDFPLGSYEAAASLFNVGIEECLIRAAEQLVRLT